MEKYSVINTNVERVDAVEKATGKAIFTSDVHPEGMLYGRILGSPIANGIIKSIDTSLAESLPGVKTVITGKDVPEARHGAIADRHILCKKYVRYVDDFVAAVAATTPEIAEEACGLIKVDYEELPAVFDAKEAYDENCKIVVHENLNDYFCEPIPLMVYRKVPGHPNVYFHRQIRHGGDIDEVFAKADYIYEDDYTVPRVSHCTIEPHVTVAKPEADGGLTFWASEQTGIRFKNLICDMFNLNPSKVHFIIPYVGGAFGGKGEILVGPIAVALALKANAPVCVEFTREEVFVNGVPRSPATVHIKDGIMKDGTIVAREIFQIVNGGAYSDHSCIMLHDGAFGAVGTYRIPNFKLDSMGVYTNTPATGPYRSLGSEIFAFAIECQMDRISDKFGFDKLNFRIQNMLNDGDPDCCGQETYNNTAVAALKSAAEYIEWGKDTIREEGPWIIGKGLAVANKYTMSGTNSIVTMKMNCDGTLDVYHFHVEIGQGCNTLHRMVAAEQFGIDPKDVRIIFDDSDTCPYDYGTFCSRGTFHVCNATINACKDLKKKICNRGSDIMKIPAEKLDVKNRMIFEKDNPDNVINVRELFDYFGVETVVGELRGVGIYDFPMGEQDDETGQGSPTAYYSHGALGIEAAINRDTGEIKLLRCGTWCDMGTQLNPKMCDAQSEGALMMGIGQTCFEEELFNESGKVINANFRDYKIPTMLDVPFNDYVAVGNTGWAHKDGPYGAKGAGEVVLAPVMPAVANAINNALGIQMNDVPINREILLKKIREIQAEK